MGFGVLAPQNLFFPPRLPRLPRRSLSWLFMRGAAGVSPRLSQSQRLCESPPWVMGDGRQDDIIPCGDAMKTRPVLAILLFVAGAALLWLQIPAAASPDQQAAFPSPTPGPDGRIILIVKAGETCTQISLLYGVSVEYIRTTNLLDENCTLREGQSLMIGVGGPSYASPSPGPSPTPTVIPSTPTPGVGGSGQVCVLVYNDANGDALRQSTEPAIAGAAISLTNPGGNFSQTLTSVINPDATVYQGMCFPNVPPGTYNVSAAAPDGYNATINMTTKVDIVAGDTVYVDFGAQPKVANAPGVAAPASKGPSPLLGIAGAALLLGGIGLGLYAWRMLRNK